ncbi:uncharacterized protein LOC114410667 [Glycine soja]|uniref:uncharacterized protein LOC114410667 n=1 Tax=Glycine soja TaxID=3848 RepID=UPI00103C2EA7|nr:uncharacterized protein LOC114410667 [Glycine soja]
MTNRIIGRALGREDHHDSDYAPQRRRPTTSTRRQREPAPIAEDEPVVAADVHAPDADGGHDAEGFPGGRCDPSVLTEYADHVAINEHPELKLSSHGRKVQKFGRLAPEIKGLVVATGLSPLIACSVDSGDRGLISAFMKRWHRETSSFHLLVGEVSITLDDVASLLHLPIVGAFHTFEPLHVDEAMLMLVELLEVSGEEARAETTQYHGPYCWIYEHFPSVAGYMADPDYDEVSPRACRWNATKATLKSISIATYRQRLDRLRIPDVCWMPYGEHRPVREFDLISCFFGQLRWGPVAVRH